MEVAVLRINTQQMKRKLSQQLKLKIIMKHKLLLAIDIKKEQTYKIIWEKNSLRSIKNSRSYKITFLQVSQPAGGQLKGNLIY